jgi:hypothetical protein
VLSKTSYVIDHSAYGDRQEFDSLEDAEDRIHKCGPDFVGIKLAAQGNQIHNERNEVVGHLATNLTPWAGSWPTRTANWTRRKSSKASSTSSTRELSGACKDLTDAKRSGSSTQNFATPRERRCPSED